MIYKSFTESYTQTKFSSDRFNPFKQLSENKSNLFNFNNSYKHNNKESDFITRNYKIKGEQNSLKNIKDLVGISPKKTRSNPYLIKKFFKKSDRWNVYDKIATKIKFQKKFNNLEN